MKGIDDLTVFPDQDQVALAAHQLADEPEFGPVAQFIGGLKVQGEDAVQALLADGGQPPAAQVFAQQQAEHRRGGRVLDGDGRKMQPRSCPGQNHQPAHRPAVVQVQNNAIPVGLPYFIHAGTDHRFQLLGYFMQKSAVKRHGYHVLCFW